MTEPIDELIDQDIEKALTQIKVGAYGNNFIVDRETADPNPPDSIAPQDVYCLIVPGDIQPMDTAEKQGRDYFTATWFLMCYVFESNQTGGRWDKRMRTIHWDIRKALRIDRQRGQNPRTNSKLAITTRIPVARPMELSQPEHRGVIVQVDVDFWTSTDDGYSP